MFNTEGIIRRALFRYRSQHTWSLPAHTRKRIFTTALHNGIDRYLTQWAGRDWKTKRKETGKKGRSFWPPGRQAEGEKCRCSVTGLLALTRGGLLCFAGPVPSPHSSVRSLHSFHFPLSLSIPAFLSFPLEFRKELHLIEGNNNNLISKATRSAKNRFRQISYSSSRLYQIRFHSLQFVLPVSPDCGLFQDELSFISKSHRGKR